MNQVSRIAGRGLRAFVASLVVGAGAASATAQGIHDELPTCPGFLFVWDDACTATAVLRCENGDIITLDRMRPDGGEVGTRLTSDGDILYSYDVMTFEGIGPRLEVRDPLSIETLRARKTDDFDATHQVRLQGQPFTQARISGEATLDGGTVTVSGRALLTGSLYRRLDFGAAHPSVTQTFELFLDPSIDLFLLGRGRTSAGGSEEEPQKSGGRPTQFFETGEPGFDHAFDLGAGCDFNLSSILAGKPHG